MRALVLVAALAGCSAPLHDHVWVAAQTSRETCSGGWSCYTTCAQDRCACGARRPAQCAADCKRSEACK